MAINPKSPKIFVGTATCQTQASSASCHLNMDLPVTDAQIMPGFQHSLLDIGKLFDEDFTVLFKKHSIQVFNPDGDTILNGKSDPSGPYLWRFSLLPKNIDAPPAAPLTTAKTAAAFRADKIPSVEALLRFYHASAGFPVKFAWLSAIKASNYTSWPVLTAANATKYCPEYIATKK